MKNLTIIFLSIIASSAVAFADASTVSFRCTDSSMASCAQRTADELSNQGCIVGSAAVVCEDGAPEDVGVFYCFSESQNCSDASSDGFIGVDCNNSQKVKIKDSYLSATWAKGFFSAWVKNMCVAK